MEKESNRNTIVFFVCALALLFGYETFVMGPAEKRKEAAARQAAAMQQKLHPGVPLAPGAAPQAVYLPLDKALAASPRVRIETPALTGSVALKGGRIDNLDLKGYRETTDPKSPLVELLRPEGADHAYFVQTGWTGANVPGLPNEDTLWTAPAGAVLSPGHPVTLTYAAPAGLMFTRTLAVDDKAMFTAVDQVINRAAAPVALAPYGSVQRLCPASDKDPCLPPGALRSGVVHEGAIGWLGARLKLEKYGKWKKDDQPQVTPSTGGWLGITDKYWMAALVPDQTQQIQGTFRVTPSATANVFEANYVGPLQTAAPGAAISQTVHLYAGAKTVPVLQAYQKSLGVPEFDQAVDWGNFWFLTRPLFTVVEFFYQHVGNFGIAILLLTVAVRIVFFPLANKSYESLTKMKKVQPQLEQIKKRAGGDAAKQQQEMMALYQKEKINPFMGCIPMLLQIPVFFALYKVLSVTIEMRHAPFFGWVQDLSARDPTTFVNLFGLLPFDPATVPMIGLFLAGPLHIGLWPLAYLVTMWLTMSMSPQTGMDPTQQKVMQFMPLIFMFSISGVAVGLVIYWAWSNVLSIFQQYIIMRRFKVDNPIDQIARRLTGKAAPA
ncbi:MAG: 60 kDa inner rane insertion protein [Caulobacteraceae bacterium]|nr:60 kDa inner rane insertion protein [Caulobacteraceae bacterium]